MPSPRQGSTPVLGVLHVPVTKETFFAVEGRGAFVRRQVSWLSAGRRGGQVFTSGGCLAGGLREGRGSDGQKTEMGLKWQGNYDPMGQGVLADGVDVGGLGVGVGAKVAMQGVD